MDGKAHDETQNTPLIKKRNLRWGTSAAEPVLVVWQMEKIDLGNISVQPLVVQMKGNLVPQVSLKGKLLVQFLTDA